MRVSLLILFLLFLLPFFVLPFGTSYFETPKVLIAEATISMMFFGITSGFRSDLLKENHIGVGLIGVLLLLSLLHLLLHPSALTFLGNAFRHQGVFLLWGLLLFALFSSRIKLPPIPLWFLMLLAVGEFIAALFIGGTSDGRAVGTLGEPNALAAFAVFLWTWAACSSQKRPTPIAFFVITTIAVAGILLLSGSRSGMIAWCTVGVFFLLYTFFRFSLSMTTIVCILCVGASLSLPFFQQQVVYENRAEIWQTALFAGYEHPIIGWGFGNTEVALTQYNKKLFNRLRGYYVDSSHNVFLDYWIQGGFIGLASFVGLIYATIRSCVQRQMILELAVFFVVLIALSFNPASVVTLLALWWLIGRGLGFRNEEKSTIIE